MSKNSIDKIQEDIRDIRNDIERIKGDTHNLNRITTIASTSIIITDLKNIIGTSSVRATMIHLTKDEISAQKLAEELGISHHNIPKYIFQLTEKGYISEIKRNGRKYYKRSETIDLINFESNRDFSKMIESQRKKKEEKGIDQDTI